MYYYNAVWITVYSKDGRSSYVRHFILLNNIVQF